MVKFQHCLNCLLLLNNSFTKKNQLPPLNPIPYQHCVYKNMISYAFSDLFTVTLCNSYTIFNFLSKGENKWGYHFYTIICMFFFITSPLFKISDYKIILNTVTIMRQNKLKTMVQKTKKKIVYLTVNWFFLMFRN